MPLLQDIIGFAKDPTGKRATAQTASGSSQDDSQDTKKRQVDLEAGRIPGQEYQSVDAYPFLPRRNGQKRSNGKTR